MNEFARLTTELVCRPWLIPAHVHRSLCDSVANMRIEDGPEERKQFEIADGIAVIPIDGVLSRYETPWTISIGEIRRQIKVASDDPEIVGIMLLIDSPGGSAMGIPEAARAVAAAQQVKPVMAYVDGYCCSGAYWLASQARYIYATESADVGCIGCYMAMLDQSVAAAMQGLRVEVFRSGRFKGMGIPGTSLTDEQRAYLQASVDRIAGQFKSAVRSARGSVRDEVMEGQSFDASAALAETLIDSVADAAVALRDVADMAKNYPRGGIGK